MTEVIITVRTPDGVTLAECEMMWDEERCPADRIECIPTPWDFRAGNLIPTVHPAQATLLLKKEVDAR